MREVHHSLHRQSAGGLDIRTTDQGMQNPVKYALARLEAGG